MYACEAENGIGSPLSAEFSISVQGIVSCSFSSQFARHSPVSSQLCVSSDPFGQDSGVSVHLSHHPYREPGLLCQPCSRRLLCLLLFS